MGDATGIEWTDATWNPVVGCSILSPGCTNCYAMSMAVRIERMTPGSHYAGTTRPSKAGPVWTGKVALAPEHILTAPLRWKKPRRIFVNSMGDLFHDDVPDEWIDRMFRVMAMAGQHTFQVLTKRAGRMRRYLEEPGRELRIRSQPGMWPLPNVWLGVSAERQQEADERIPHLLATPAAVRFVSAEPLLGPVDFRFLQPGDPPVEIDALNGTHGVLRPHRGWSPRLDWVIVGGESGPGARPMHPDWARSIRDHCAAAGVPFFFKQWGEWEASLDRERDDPDGRADYTNDYVDCGKSKWLNLAGGRGFHGERFHVMRRVGKRAAGRLLDGRTHDAMPEAPT